MAVMTTPSWFSRPLTAAGVRAVQRKLMLPVTGVQDASFRLALSGFQTARGLPVTGTADEVTAEALGESEEYILPPSWWTKNLATDGAAVLRFLEQHDLDWAWLARLQGNMGRKPDGLIDVQVAWEMDKFIAA